MFQGQRGACERAVSTNGAPVDIVPEIFAYANFEEVRCSRKLQQAEGGNGVPGAAEPASPAVEVDVGQQLVVRASLVRGHGVNDDRQLHVDWIVHLASIIGDGDARGLDDVS